MHAIEMRAMICISRNDHGFGASQNANRAPEIANAEGSGPFDDDESPVVARTRPERGASRTPQRFLQVRK